MAVVACSTVLFISPSNASNLPTGLGVDRLVHESFDGSSLPSSLTALVAERSSALLPCITTVSQGVGQCSASSGAYDDGEGGQMLLTDASAEGPNASGIAVKQAFASSRALYAQFETQSYGAGGGARTIWLMDASSATPTIPSADGTGGYGSATAGIPGAFLGITLDAAGTSALTNGDACPSNGWSSRSSTANQVVVKARDTSAARGTSGYCFVSSTEQQIGSLSTQTSTLGSLHQADVTDGWQRVFVSILPPSFTSNLAQLTVAVDAADGRGLQIVLDIALPNWAWSTTGTNVPSLLRFGIAASNPTNGTASDVVALRTLDVVTIAPVADVPSEPRNVGVQWSSPVGGFVNATVTWTAPLSDGFRAITNYTAMVNGDTCNQLTLTTPVLTCTVTNIPAGDAYTVAVVATNEIGDSDAGVTVSRVNAQLQTITLPTISNVVFGTTPPRLSPSSSSGLPVAMSASGACTMANGQLMMAQAGTCTVTATQVGSLSFEAATPVVRTFNIIPASAVIKVQPISVVVDGGGHPVVVTATPSVLPTTVSYCPVASPTQCSAIAPSAVGTYITTVRSASTNYTVAPVVTTVDVLPSTTNLPPEAGGPKFGTNRNVTMTLQPPNDPKAASMVQTSGGGFTAGAPVAIAVTGQESLGTFTIPTPGNVGTLTSALSPSSGATTVQSATLRSAVLPSDLSTGSSIAYPFGNFPGAGDYIVVTMSSSGFVPGSTVSTLLHSTPIVITTSTADANGAVTIQAPIPASFAGQSHKLVINGTYLASSTKANGDGTVSATTAVPADLLARLEPTSQLVVTAIDQADPTIFAKSYIDIAAGATVTTTTVAGSANDVLQAPPLVPTDHPAETMKQVTNLVAVAATVAATASVAASVAGSVGSVRVPTGGAPAGGVRSSGGPSGSPTRSESSEPSTSSESSSPMSTQQIGAAFDEIELHAEKLGDRSRLWRTPGRQIIDRVSAQAPLKVGTVSPMMASAISDGSYLRAMFGSLSAVLPLFGVLFGIFNVIESHGYPVPGNYVTFAVLMVLGALDGWSGLAATATILIGAIASGHIFSLSMAVSFSLTAALLFGTAIIVKGVRPLIRDSFDGFQDRWKRAGDMVVGPLFGGFLATQLIGASASAAGLDLPITKHALFIGVTVGLALFARYAISTVAIIHFPRRLSEVSPDHKPSQATWASIASQILRQVFTALLLHAFLGWSWVLLMLIGLQMAQGFVAPKISGQLPKVLYRLVPRGVANILVMATIGTLGGRLMGQITTDGFWQIAGLLLLLGVVGLLYAMVSALEGEDFPVTWTTRIAGVGVVVITALQLTGRLI